jgi:hypothetical protein
LHLDYTEPLPEACTSGTRYFQVSVWGGYINLQPLTSLRAEHTTVALRATVAFFRPHGVSLDTLRMDNQTSQPFIDVARQMGLQFQFVSPYVKQANRAERSIHTAKNHIIATRAGFHPDCPHAYLDKCMFQIERTLNIVKPFEYDPTTSAYEDLYGHTFNFYQHPIAPVGSKVLTWDSPKHRGTWAGHGIEAVYLGPAVEHLRAFNVWVPNTSAPRVTNTVWWFLRDLTPDPSLIGLDPNITYPPTKARPNPREDGTYLIGRAFFEPELGVCLLTGTGPVTHNQLATRARLRQNHNQSDPILSTGAHYTLTYRQLNTGEKNFSSLTEILHWIATGPLLQPPSVPGSHETGLPITTPAYVPVSIQYVPHTQHVNNNDELSAGADLSPRRLVENVSANRKDVLRENVGSANQNTSKDILRGENVRVAKISKVTSNQSPPLSTTSVHDVSSVPRRESQRLREQRVCDPTKQRMPLPTGANSAIDDLPTFVAPTPPLGFENLTVEQDIDRFLLLCEDLAWREQQAHPVDDTDHRLMPSALANAVTVPSCVTGNPLLRPMLKSALSPVFPSGPLNLNPDGTTINLKKSHGGPNADHWSQADSEEMERLFTTGTIPPICFRSIPHGRVITYVNPVCVEKVNDDGSIKFRTRLTIGGDRIVYPYDKSAVTAEMDALKILLNCMISENANWSTIDLTDFYLGTGLPHPEYIRIPTRHIPPRVITFYKLHPFIDNDVLYCSVHKTHYGLPQAGALSQQRLFKHLKENGYHQLPRTPSVFRNEGGFVRFTLVVDDFAVMWTSKPTINHFIRTLTKLYTVKVN